MAKAQLLTVKQAATDFNRCTATVYNWIRTGRVKSTIKNGITFISATEMKRVAK